MILLSIYGIGVLLCFLILAVPYFFDKDGLAVLGIGIGAFGAVLWPLLLILLIWDGVKWFLLKLYTMLSRR